jgi:hypothetical protein
MLAAVAVVRLGALLRIDGEALLRIDGEALRCEDARRGNSTLSIGSSR